jgi:hypothetical protein
MQTEFNSVRHHCDGATGHRAPNHLSAFEFQPDFSGTLNESSFASRRRTTCSCDQVQWPSEMAYSRGQIYLIETAGMETWSLDTVRQTATLILGAPTDPYTDDKNVLGSPFAVAVTYNGDIFVGDVGGKPAQINIDTHSALVKRPALLEKFPQIGAMTADPRNGAVVLIDRHAILRWTPETNGLERLGGSYYRSGFLGDGGPAKNATFNWPQGLTIDRRGNIFVADTENCRLRRIDAESGNVTTVAGGTACQSTGDGQSAKVAQLNNPRALTVDSQGTIFLSEGCRVRRIDPQGVITTYAGTGLCGFKGDGGLAINAMVHADGLAIDDNGNLYISDYSHNRIRCVDGRTHVITTFAGNGLPKRIDILM